MRFLHRALLVTAASSCGFTTPHASAAIVGYWPITETSGTTLANIAGGTPGTLNGNVTFFNDPVRGQVLQFSGGGYVDAGVVPQLTVSNDFTWAFWALNETDPVALPNVVVVGNRYADPAGTEFVPREFTKFTTTKFEYHQNAIGENAEYNDLINGGGWTHLGVVKQGNHLIAYQNGIIQAINRITVGQNNAQPFYFGGNGFLENWTGKLDDVAIWSDALPTSSIVGLAKSRFTPPNAPLSSTPPTLQTVLSENFSAGLANWTPTNRGLENNAAAGYNPPDTTGLQVSLSGTTTSEFWYGNSIESNTRFSSALETLISVDRVSLTGMGTAYRSSLWVLGSDGHYLHFAQDIGELGWSWNARDDGGLGTLLPTGSGNNIPELDALDTDAGLHSMSIQLIPTGTIGEVNMLMFLDGNLVAGRGFTNFPADFTVVLTGQGRAIGDQVTAVFDNVRVQQVPEPTTAVLLLAGVLAGGVRRRILIKPNTKAVA